MVGLSLLTACFKKNNFPSQPSLEIVSFEAKGDSAVLTMDFKDGEGDIGLNPADTLPPYDVSSKYYYNLYLVYYEKVDGEGWQVGLDPDGNEIQFKTRLLPVYEGKPKSIEGRIAYTIEPIYYNLLSPDNDTIKYRVQLIDRALNESDWVETQPFIR